MEVLCSKGQSCVTHNPTPDRVAYLDVIRIMATLGVIALHVYCTDYQAAVGTYNWFVSVIGDGLVRWSVPLFVMISGALFLQPAKEVTYRLLLKKYIPRLLLAYVFWSLAYSATKGMVYCIDGREFQIGILVPHFHLWYLPLLMGVYLLIPILRKISSDGRLMRVVLALWIVYLAGCFCRLDLLPQVGILFEPNSIVGFAGYFLLGHYVRQHDITRKQARWIYLIGIMGAAVCVCGSIVISYLRGVSDTSFLNYIGIPVVAMSLALFVLVKQTTPFVEFKWTWIVDYVRKDLFGIYLTHGLWLMVFNTPLFRNLCSTLLTLPLITIVIFFLSLYTTKLLRLVPLLRKTVE